MGNEVQGALRTRGERHEGKILLETNEIIFRGGDHRFKIAFGEIQRVTAGNGELRIATKDGAKVFEVGAAAEKWREKILHPRTRAQKLGVKAGTRVRIVGEFAADFAKELRASRAKLVPADGSVVESTFLAAEARNSLSALARHAKSMRGAEALWVVYPKGRGEITERDVLSAGRRAGLKDIKVVGFSPTHTALKFVLPVPGR